MPQEWQCELKQEIGGNEKIMKNNIYECVM